MTSERETTDDGGRTDEPNAPTQTLTLSFEIPLDDLHGGAWESVLAAAPDPETAKRTVASRVEFATDPRTAIYQQHRLVEQQREQVGAQMAADGGGGDSDTDTEAEAETEDD